MVALFGFALYFQLLSLAFSIRSFSLITLTHFSVQCAAHRTNRSPISSKSLRLWLFPRGPKRRDKLATLSGRGRYLVVRVENPVCTEAAAQVGGGVVVEHASNVQVEQLTREECRLVSRGDGIAYLSEVHWVGHSRCRTRGSRGGLIRGRSSRARAACYRRTAARSRPDTRTGAVSAPTPSPPPPPSAGMSPARPAWQ